MSRIDEIKVRVYKYKAAQGYANQRTPEFVKLVKEQTRDFQENGVTDMEFLLSKLDAAEKALEKITEDVQIDSNNSAVLMGKAAITINEMRGTAKDALRLLRS